MTTAKPFVKYLGGKTKLLPILTELVPDFKGRYFESFVGGGALLWKLSPERATIVDLNEELINAYSCVKNHLDELIEDLDSHKYEKDYFYHIRSKDRLIEYQYWTPVQRASRYIYLIKCCFNAVSRYNLKHQFNAPFGRHTNPKICDRETLIACHDALKNVTIVHGTYNEIDTKITSDDFIFLDPPYLKNFSQYTGTKFGETEHADLSQYCHSLDQRGIRFMLTNSSCEEVYDLYQGFKISVAEMPRNLNCKSDKRGKVKEVIVTNY